jgi:hypothetical protein
MLVGVLVVTLVAMMLRDLAAQWDFGRALNEAFHFIHYSTISAAAPCLSFLGIATQSQHIPLSTAAADSSTTIHCEGGSAAIVRVGAVFIVGHQQASDE